MRRQLLASIALSIALLGAIPAAAAGASTAPASGTGQCKNGGWRTLVDDHGQPFKNQGQCIKWKRQHPVSLNDLAGTFTGTESFDFGTNGCSFVHQIFDASYPGSAAVGIVTLHIEGCVDNPITHYEGTFTITTSVGTLSGTAVGPVFDFELDLNITSATGAFQGVTGMLHASIHWDGVPSTSITGAVTA